jgi:DNA-directed RNA polymerase specialized sigma subunit
MTTTSPPRPALPEAVDAPRASDVPDPLRALVAAAASGDRDAKVRLLSLVAPPVTATIRALLGSSYLEIDDAVQEALLAIVGSLDRFRGESSFLHYARRIAVRTAGGPRARRSLSARASRRPRVRRRIISAEGRRSLWTSCIP